MPAMRDLIVRVSVLLFLAYRPAVARDLPDYDGIDAYVGAAVQRLHVPGLALGIVHGDEIAHLQAFGVADPSGRPMTPETPLIIGSLSKSFTAMAVMQLVDAGKIDLDAPVRRYLPWFRVADENASSRITVRQLLHHTSGLSTLTSQRFSTDDDVSETALESRVRALSTVELTSPVGATYHYCGTNYAVLGLIVQTVSGESYESYLTRRIFTPLAMLQSFTNEAAADSHGLAKGYLYVFGFPVASHLPFNRGSIAQGYLMSTAEDMAHYLIAQLNDGRYRGEQIVSPEAMAEMHAPSTQTGDAATSYGMGWEIGPLGGVPVIWHEGSVFNFHANMALIPDGRWGVVMLKNIYSGPDEGRLNAIMAGVVDLVAGRTPPTIPSINPALVAAYAVVLCIVAAQLLFVTRWIRRLRRWHVRTAVLPRHWLTVAWLIVLPCLTSFAWAGFLTFALPRPFGMSLIELARRIPDFGYVLLLSGAIAATWAVVKPVLYARALRAMR